MNRIIAHEVWGTFRKLPDGKQVGVVMPNTFYHEKFEQRMRKRSESWVYDVVTDIALSNWDTLMTWKKVIRLAAMSAPIQEAAE